MRSQKARSPKVRTPRASKAFDMSALEALSIADLTGVIDAAIELRAQRVVEAREALKQDMEAKAQALGLSVNEVLGMRRGRGGAGKPRGPAPIKYRGPKGEAWSGRGRPPRWLAALEAKGHKREKYLV
jgi:DNA-binding protein H-NS